MTREWNITFTKRAHKQTEKLSLSVLSALRLLWEVRSKEIRIIEVYYVGTHEHAPY